MKNLDIKSCCKTILLDGCILAGTLFAGNVSLKLIQEDNLAGIPCVAAMASLAYAYAYNRSDSTYIHENKLMRSARSINNLKIKKICNTILAGGFALVGTCLGIHFVHLMSIGNTIGLVYPYAIGSMAMAMDSCISENLEIHKTLKQSNQFITHRLR